MYSAISKNGNTHFYFNGQLILKAVTWKYFCFDKFYIEDSKGSKLIEISILSMFGFWKKYSIKSQNLKNYVELFKFKGQLILKAGNKEIYINKKNKLRKFEGEFFLNKKKYGYFDNKLTMFKSTFTFHFQTQDEDTNTYCIMLFSIMVIDKFNFGPS
ncbi:hypothetical protein [Avrilella dinanensis]|uniref:Uncharacterized protein n=1 Tax=Avrilella dinanensis TaxID=2008672 RepID=A0A2M9R4C8_9FLAO|nr:hypothetical protein [Avrilella dinanensis]PJR03721.1 hypothetical protein CDL10_03675 [Avrilella dinanensis]